MEVRHRETAEGLRSRLEQGRHDAAVFRAALLNVPPLDRDAWLDLVLGLRELPDDGPDLPNGCVPYLPCAVDVLLRLIEQASVQPSDVFVDVGAGLGRAAAFVNLLTGAGAIGIEIQSDLVRAGRDLTARLAASRVACIQGDAAVLTGLMTTGSVFFLYCPFSGPRLQRVIADLEAIARTRPIRVCCHQLPLPPCAWLTLDSPSEGDLAVYRSRA